MYLDQLQYLDVRHLISAGKMAVRSVLIHLCMTHASEISRGNFLYTPHQFKFRTRRQSKINFSKGIIVAQAGIIISGILARLALVSAE